ncbi:MAG: tRNA 2-thiouridine(34) synthase MnmA [Lachnospiraceae bacterium]|nr:tRNA 2-thiouridine(34) synthase MnmA [Lachnospiraceae bacterium]
MAKVIAGMSGGVDSAVAAYLLKEQGHEVIGVTLRTWIGEDGSEGRCCEIDDAYTAARAIGIPYHTFNCVSDFANFVTKPFTEAYLKGITPNPCVICNRYIKWDGMMNRLPVFGASHLATGHYANIVRLDNGRFSVKRSAALMKDQTYMLYMLTQEQLAHTMLPLGGYTKDEVREIAKKAGIPVADKKDSQEICFIPDDDYAGYICRNVPKEEIPPEGDFTDEDGKVLGRHKGIINYTVGQRKGLGLPLGYPAYVKDIDAGSGRIIVAPADALLTDVVYVRDLNFMSIEDPGEGEEFRAVVKIRYHHAGEAASLVKTGEDEIKIVFDKPVRAAAPGQSAVFYDDEGCVIGGGRIVRQKN